MRGRGGGGEGAGERGLNTRLSLSCTLQIPTSIGQTQVEAGQDPVPETEGACTWGQTEPIQYTQPELGLQSGLSDPRSCILSSPTGKCQWAPLSLSPSISPQLPLTFPSLQGSVGSWGPQRCPPCPSSRASAHRGLLSLCLPSLHRE